jgi:hypothetical protein
LTILSIEWKKTYWLVPCQLSLLALSNSAGSYYVLHLGPFINGPSISHQAAVPSLCLGTAVHHS